METGEEIVISGISGRFPECHNVEEFKMALLRGDDLMTEDDRRFPAGINGLPKRQGKVPDIDKFDATFFGLHSKQAHFTDPRQRILLEAAYEAIVDSGFNPIELKGTKTGVFVGMSLFTNFDEITSEDPSGYSILGMSHTSAANRISYCFDFKGPSYALDTGCSSSLYVFSQAVDLLKRGQIEHALVAGTHLGLNPEESMLYHKLKMLSPDGKCKVFSKERDGFARSESICCFLLQKKRNSRRMYAEVVGSKTNTNGYVKEGYTVPSAEMQLKLMQELYDESNVDVEDVSYIEMHGTGSRIGDIIECQSILDMFCKKRKSPLLVGSVKSNMGHGETVSGLAAITKVLMAMETGIIPANLHVDPIDEDLPGIRDKKLKVVTSNIKWKPTLVGVNSFGFGGANAHVILKPINKRIKPIINRKHRLVQVSGRTEEAVNHFLEEIQKHLNDEDFLSLVDEIHKFNIEGHYFRGYTVLGESPVQEVKHCKSEKRPIWFIFSGMGSHWPGMGKDLMSIEVFRNTFKKCAAAVTPYGIDLLNVIMNSSAAALEDLGNCFCAIIAVVVSLIDLLTYLGIVPDFFAGHSLGEVGCAYANGDLTPEQAVLLAYSKSYAVKKQLLPIGQMAVVGLSSNEINKILPNNVFVACVNGRNNVTISGLEEPVKDFVEKLTKDGVFAKFVYTGQIAFHSTYLMDSDKYMLEFVRKIIPDPKPRLRKWITTSVAPEQTQENWTKYNGPEYHANNYKSRVIFNDIYKSVQSNAIVVEIGPHSIMQSIMKKEMGTGNTLIGLLDRNAENQKKYLLSSIGRIFTAGGQPNLRNFYNETTFPVNPGTKMLAPLVKWDHSVSWFVPYWKSKDYFERVVSTNLPDKESSCLKEFNFDGGNGIHAKEYLNIFSMASKKINSCLETLERFIIQRVTAGSSLAKVEKKEVLASSTPKTPAQKVADILGIENLDYIDTKATLSKLGLDSLMLAEVKHTLHRHFELDFGPENIRDITFEYLINLQNETTVQRPIVVENFPPPLLSEVPVVRMDENQNVKRSKILFMIHPIEGYLHYLMPLAKKLPGITYGLQCTKESNYKTIQDSAKYFSKLIKGIQGKGPYYICGYSYGATLGFEIGIQLETEGEEVEIVAIDGAPDYARQVFTDSTDMNSKIIKLFPVLFKEVDLDKIKQIMNSYTQPEDSIDTIFEHISKETGLGLESVKNSGEQYFNRCNASFLYKPFKKFNGNIKLIRRLHNSQAQYDDYGLQKICTKSVEVIKLNGDHITILFGDNQEKLCNIINDWIMA